PFAHDADFVERGTTLEDLYQRCAASDSPTALVGLGGAWVFWVYASNAARFEQSLRDIADSVKLAGRQDPQANIFKLVQDWLRDCKHRWLLMLESVDNARFLLDRPAVTSKSASVPLREYLPHRECGSIIVTTRNRDAALKLVERRDVITVGPMDEAEDDAL
ncbi:hypothetical protein EJ02DRAFT_298860, partial [Clathrospora elynae]